MFLTFSIYQRKCIYSISNLGERTSLQSVAFRQSPLVLWDYREISSYAPFFHWYFDLSQAWYFHSNRFLREQEEENPSVSTCGCTGLQNTLLLRLRGVSGSGPRLRVQWLTLHRHVPCRKAVETWRANQQCLHGSWEILWNKEGATHFDRVYSGTLTVIKKNNKFFQFLFFCWLPGFPIFLQCSNTGVIVRVHLATQELDMGMVQETHPSYDLYQTFFSTSDTGHGGAARDRTYVIGSHGDRTSCKVDPEEVKDIISKRMKGKVRTVPSDYFMAQLVEVELEAQQLACKRKVEYKEGCRDFRYLLTEREKRALQSYESSYLREFGEEAHLNPNLVVFLGDNGSTWKTWSAKSNQISTFRKNSKTGLYWSPHLQRFMVAREKLAALAWPVTGTMAKAMCCGQIPSQDIHRAADLAGNAMHFTTVAVAQLLALACFRPLD